MRLLILSGTRFVGRHLGEAALRDGRWDAVVDVSGYRPESVRAAAAVLRGRAARYVFVSTASVYREFQNGGAEDAATWDPATATPEQAGPELYGPRKRACELALAEAWDGPWCVARPCVVAGPHDLTDRFTYWPVRLARGGRVLVPGAPEAFVQFVDARDLANFLLKAAAGGAEGIFNVVGPALAFPALLDACAAGAKAEFVPAPDEFLVKAGVAPYVDLPLRIPGRTRAFDGGKAAAAGFRARPVQETAADVRRARGPEPLAAGLTAEREARLLAELGGGLDRALGRGPGRSRKSYRRPTAVPHFGHLSDEVRKPRFDGTSASQAGQRPGGESPPVLRAPASELFFTWESPSLAFMPPPLVRAS